MLTVFLRRRTVPIRCGALLSIIALGLIAVPASFAADSKSSSAREDLIAAIRAHRAALDRLLEFHIMSVRRATAEVEKRRDLLARGSITQRALEESERALEIAEGKMAATRREMALADQSLADAMAQPRPSTEQSGKVREDELLAYLNRGEGLGLFRACAAQNVGPQSWIVVLCVPLPKSLPASQRGLMKPGVGVQALRTMNELEQRYRGLAFRVYVSSEITDKSGVAWGYAFRDERGKPYYNAQRPYQ
jgi:hypothetical protein